MLVSWMAYASLVTALLAVGAFSAESITRICAVPRRWAWFIALLIATLTPPLLAIRPVATSPSSAPRVVSVSTPISTRSSPTLADRHSPLSAPSERPARSATVVAPIATRLAPYVILAWLAASAALLGMFALAALRLRLQSRLWRTAIVDDVPVLISSDIGPAVIGTLRPRIVVAEWTLALDATKRTLMLRHELEHIRARDPLLLRVAALSLIAFPWNPALWFVVRRLRQSIEIDCDARVLRAADARTDSSRDYGMLLLLVGARRAAPLPTAAGFTGYPPFLERRIKAMTSQRPRRPTLHSVGLLSIVVLSTVAAARAPLPPSLRPISRATRTAPGHQQIAMRHLSRAPLPIVAPHSYALISVPTVSVDRVPPLALIDTNPSIKHDQSTITGVPFPLAPPQGHPTSREATGRVVDSATNSPIANVYVNVIGVQALNEPNWTCSDANGVFRLRVPIGEAWLSAQSVDHAFSRVTLAPSDSVAILRGTFIPIPPLPDIPPPDRIASVTVSPKYTPLFIIDGVPQPPQSDSVHLTVRTVNGAVIERDVSRRDARPKFFVDGVEISPDGVPGLFTNPCAR